MAFTRLKRKNCFVKTEDEIEDEQKPDLLIDPSASSWTLAAKRRRLPPVANDKTCTICTSTLHRAQFPFPRENDHSHGAGNVCTDCLREWISTQIAAQNITFRTPTINHNDDEVNDEQGQAHETEPGVRCPESLCPAILRYESIHIILGESEIWTRFEAAILRRACEALPNWEACTAPTYVWGAEIEEGLRFFACPVCGHGHCVLCKRSHGNAEGCGGAGNEGERVYGNIGLGGAMMNLWEPGDGDSEDSEPEELLDDGGFIDDLGPDNRIEGEDENGLFVPLHDAAIDDENWFEPQLPIESARDRRLRLEAQAWGPVVNRDQQNSPDADIDQDDEDVNTEDDISEDGLLGEEDAEERVQAFRDELMLQLGDARNRRWERSQARQRLRVERQAATAAAAAEVEKRHAEAVAEMKRQAEEVVEKKRREAAEKEEAAKKAADWDADERWKVMTTRLCPGCKTAIEKNGGCDHMVCSCGHDFQWRHAKGYAAEKVTLGARRA